MSSTRWFLVILCLVRLRTYMKVTKARGAEMTMPVVAQSAAHGAKRIVLLKFIKL